MALKDPERPQRGQSVLHFAQELVAQISILEALFDDAGLRKLRRKQPLHPAVLRFDTLSDLLARGGTFDLARDIETVRVLATGLMDRFTWASAIADDDASTFLDDALAQRVIRSRLQRPSSFEDVMAELYFWGWLRQHAMVDLAGSESQPDLRIVADPPVWADVKRIHVGTQPWHVREVIKKANKQVRRVDPDGSGVAIVHVSRPGLRVSLDDRIPSDVQPFVNEAARQINSGFTRSIGQVVIAWDEIKVFSEPGKASAYFVIRRSEVFGNPHARRPPSNPDEFWKVGSTAAFGAGAGREPERSLPAVDAGHVVVSQAFRALNEFSDGLRVGHALEVIAEPDRLLRHRAPRHEVVVATRRFSDPDRPRMAVVLAHQQGNERPRIDMGFKLSLADDFETREMLANPFLALMVAINRFGEVLRVGNQEGRFILEGFAPDAAGGNDIIRSVGEIDPTARRFVSAIMRHRREPVAGFEVSWAFAINQDQYTAALRT